MKRESTNEVDDGSRARISELEAALWTIVDLSKATNPRWGAGRAVVIAKETLKAGGHDVSHL